MRLSDLGFDEAFDHTAPDTRRKTPERIALAALVFVISLPNVGAAALASWLLTYATAETWLWRATSPRFQRRRRLQARIERLVASFVTACGWVLLSLVWWFAGDPDFRLITVALLGGILLYVTKACHRSLAHLLVCGLPPLVCLFVVPASSTDTLAEWFAVEGGMAILAIFATSSAYSAWLSHRQLQSATDELVKQRRAAEAANRAKSVFLANMSHEIRTPLNGVVGVAGALAETKLDTRQSEMVALIRSSGGTLERLLSDLLDLARVEAGAMTLEERPFHLADAVRATAALWELRAGEKGVRLVLDIAPEAETTVLGDEVRVRQILANIVSNAVKFTDRGVVTIRVREEASREWTLEVQDTGVGFEAADRERLFGRFQQADGSITRRFGGTGLGLAISRQLAERMGGGLDCDGRPGEGATFTARLPLPRTQAEIAAPATGPATGSDEVSLADARVLLADDHPVNRKVVELVLAPLGVRLVEVEDGRQAVEAFAEDRFDLVLMDMQMPVMDGLAATREIRRIEAAEGVPPTPIVMVSANAMGDHVSASQAAGADRHLSKPYAPAALIEVVVEAVSRRRRAEASAAAA